MSTLVWKGTYTSKDGYRTNGEISVDGEALARWFGKSAHSRAAFTKAKAGLHITHRLESGVTIRLEGVRDQDADAEGDEVQ